MPMALNKPAQPSTLGLHTNLTEEEAAAIARIEPKRLRRLLYEKRGPASIKIGRKRLYPRAAFFAWLEARTA